MCMSLVRVEGQCLQVDSQGHSVGVCFTFMKAARSPPKVAVLFDTPISSVCGAGHLTSSPTSHLLSFIYAGERSLDKIHSFGEYFFPSLWLVNSLF